MIKAICRIDSGLEVKKDAEKLRWPEYFESCPRPGDKVFDLNNAFYMQVSDVEHRNRSVPSHIGNGYRNYDPFIVIVLYGLLMTAQ
mgnify:CR=1 FL=1